MIYEAAIIRHDESTLIVGEDIGYQSFRSLILQFRHILWNCHGKIKKIDRACIKNTYNALKENAKANNTNWPELKIPIYWDGHTLASPLKYNHKHSS